MVPETNENAFGIDFSLSTSTANPESIARLKDAITHAQKALQDKNNNFEVEMLELKQKLEEWEDRLNASQQEVWGKVVSRRGFFFFLPFRIFCFVVGFAFLHSFFFQTYCRAGRNGTCGARRIRACSR